MSSVAPLFFALLSLTTVPLGATHSTVEPGSETAIQYLSGPDSEQTVAWDFRCHFGRNCGTWTRLPVPSNWELHGFGAYNYGLDETKEAERGDYRHRFEVPASWASRRVWLVFEGVMTDAYVRLNGVDLVPPHRGAFYSFRYDISEAISFGSENLLEVTVDSKSSDPSVERAERDADYWVFGGIFRPVFLESRPRQAILETAVDARHDGRLDVDVTVTTDAADRVVARVESVDGEPLGGPFGGLVGRGARVRLATDLSTVSPWSPEAPTLYRLITELRDGDTLLHRQIDLIGFRTVEVRPGEGLFLNGRRILLRGVNRHSFHPETGRSTSPDVSRRDIELMKSLNMNAVRSAHYPPDRHLLDLCDELGLLVVDELSGWHDAYYTASGSPLVKAMVEHDRNHPSVILWANGNEGGSNLRLDPLFRLYDPQKRPVIHPDAVRGGFDTRHYPTWKELADSLQGPGTRWQRLRHRLFGEEPSLVLPTEMLHGLYDGGIAAGLDAYWDLIASAPRGAGGFLWSLFDEAVVRTDQDRRLDSDADHGPDGLVGPYRQLEGSALGVQEIWAPVRLLAPLQLDDNFDDILRVESLFHSTNLDRTRMDWELLDFPTSDDAGSEVILAHGSLRPPSILPGNRGEIPLQLPDAADCADALRLSLFGPQGRQLRIWVLPRARNSHHGWSQEGENAREIKSPTVMNDAGGLDGTSRSDERGWLYIAGDFGSQQKHGEKCGLESTFDREARRDHRREWVRVESAGDTFALRSESASIEFSRSTGQLARATVAGRSMALSGPRVADWRPSTTPPPSASTGIATPRVRNLGHALEVHSEGALPALRWRMDSEGWLELSYTLGSEVPGLGFIFDPGFVRGFRRLGEGPFRTWGNRLAGRRLGLWYTPANDTRTGVDWDYPEMRGYHSGVRWATIETVDLDITMDSTSDTSRYLQLLHPAIGPEPRHTSVPFPEPQLSILHWIPGIGSKFHRPDEMAAAFLPNDDSPSSTPNRGRIRLRFSLHRE